MFRSLAAGGFPVSGSTDPRVRRGLERQAAVRRELLAAGGAHLGWKVGFGAPASLEMLGLDRALIGFLTDRTLLPDGAEVSIDGWSRPVAEAEIAIHLVGDVPAGAADDAIRSAIGEVGPCIELADVAPPPTDPDEVLAGNIFHRAVLLGPGMPPLGPEPPDGLTARVTIGGEPVEVPEDVEALTGRLLDQVRLVADSVEAHGARLAAGDVVIPGSIVPPQPLRPGVVVRFELDPVGAVSVRIA